MSPAKSRDGRGPARSTKPRVVILGAGFAGLAACDLLATTGKKADLEIVIADRHNYNTFQPLLYQVATAGLSPGDIAYPVRTYLRRHPNVRFREGTVRAVDLEQRCVAFADEGPPLSYDYLIIATGAATNFFGVKGAKEHSNAIYTMEDAVAVRDHIMGSLERAAVLGAEHGELTVVLVGGGATGVEMAGTVAELRSAQLKTTYREIEPKDARIVLVEQRDRLLGGFDARLAHYAMKVLVSRGVEVRLGVAVAEVAEGRVILEGGEVIECGLVVWSAGVSAGELAGNISAPKTRGGRIAVDADLRLREHGEVFVIGDVAGASDGTADGLLPQLAQPAIQEGEHAARQLLELESGRPTKPFSYHDKGVMATIGRKAAVAELPNGLRLRGTLAWLAWLALHLVFLLGFRNRIAVILNWTWRYLWWRKSPRVIAGG
ncbi:MAG: NAD(P)/FAD-dependent oxidoreductase [Acidimicrobiales bacterium]